MHREFCTLFDRNYLLKAIALYRSLDLYCPSFHLTAFCFDLESQQVIEALNLPHLSTVPLSDLEVFDAALLSTKSDRTAAEYCWTATSAAVLYLFASRETLDEVTYLDADLMFFHDPEVLFQEMGDASVLITPHNFSPEYRHHSVNGLYNVQFLPFRKDPQGLECLQWWHDRCIEWCYHRVEGGKLGDQKYLDDWPQRFAGIHVLRHKGGGLAPWNVSQYRIATDGSAVTVDDQPLVFYHYYQVRLREGGAASLGVPWFPISEGVRRIIYQPYLKQISAALAEVREVEPEFSAGLQSTNPVIGVRESVLRVMHASARRLPRRLRTRMRHARNRLIRVRPARKAP
jgi:hypothetical protein